MENHHFTQKEFNNLFFSTLSISYLGVNTGCIVIGLLVSYFILKAHPTLLESEEKEEGASGSRADSEGSDEALMETTFNTSIGEYQEEDSKLLKKFRIERDEPNAYMEDCLNLHEVFDKPLSFYKNPRWRLFPMLIYPY